MATGNDQAGLKKIEEQISCPICLEQFTNPKVLPCFHSFCLGCVQAVPVNLLADGSHSLSCPTCRSPCPVPEEGLASLPPSFVINNLLDAYELMKKASDRHLASCDNCGDDTNADRYCKQCTKFFCQQCLNHHDGWKPFANHQTIGLDEVTDTAHQLPLKNREQPITCSKHDEPIKLFCETCQELMCRDCTLIKHKDHKYDFIAEVYKGHKDSIIATSLRPLDQEFDRLTKAKQLLINKQDETSHQAETIKEEIHATIAEVKNRLDQTEKNLMEDVNHITKHKVSVLDQQRKEVDVALSRVAECRDHVDQLVKVGTPQQVLSAKPQAVSHSESVIKSVKDKAFEPLEEANILLSKSDHIDRVHDNIASVQYTLHPMQVSLSYSPIPLVGKESTVRISLFLSDYSFVPELPLSYIECRLTAPDSDLLIPCTVTDTSRAGQYNVVFTPCTRGLHQLHVTNGIAPVNVPVSVPLEMRGAPVKTIITTDKPSGVAVSGDGLIIVSDYKSHCVYVLDSEGRIIRSIGVRGREKGQLWNPSGVAVTSKGTILVCDTNNHRIQEFTVEGDCICSVGSHGKGGPLQFHYPYGICVNKVTGQVLIVDTKNSQIQVLNPDLTFSHSFGSEGSGQGGFNIPMDATCDSQGFIYVTDRNNHCVQKFTSEGKFISVFGISNPGKLRFPSGITVDDNNLLYINNEFRSSIAVYTTDGQYVSSINKEYTNHAANGPAHLHGMSFDNSNGNLIVCCFLNSLVKIL